MARSIEGCGVPLKATVSIFIRSRTGNAETATQVRAERLGAKASSYTAFTRVIVRHVREIHHGLDDILQRAPDGGKDRLHIADGLPGLLDDIVGDDLPRRRIEAAHSAGVHPVTDDGRVAEWSRWSRRVLGR